MSLDTAWQVAIEFAQMSLLAFGGGISVLPEMHRRVVEANAWATSAEFSEMAGLAQAAPGPNILVVSLIGWKVAALPGALAAYLGMCGPSSLLVYGFSRFWESRRQLRWSLILQTSLAPITIGLALASAYLITAGAGRSAAAFLVVAATAAASLWTRIHPLWCIVIGALLGLAGWV